VASSSPAMAAAIAIASLLDHCCDYQSTAK
jgi:hypothetical protein